MAVPPLILDERELQELLQQLRVLAFLGVPEWTPPAGGDAGTMLQRAYVRLLELALLRLNEVPEKNLLAFLDAMGVSLLAPSPALAPLTFGLTKGTPPTLIPQGAQAGSQATAELPAVIFETEDDLTVIPAQITQSYTMDPVWDRYTDQTPVLGGQSVIGYTPFVGTERMPHVLYIGDDALLDFSRTTRARLGFTLNRGSRTEAVIEEFLAQLVYQYSSQGTLKTVSPTSLPSVSGNEAEIAFSISDSIDEETLQGVGPEGALQTAPNRWLRAALVTPFPDSPLAQALRWSSTVLRVDASGLLPDFAFVNTAPADVTKDFFPFGESPKVGDTFYLASREALAKPNATVTLHVGVRPSPPPKLVWEYFDGRQDEWVPFVHLSLDSFSSPEAFKAEFEKNPFSLIFDFTEGLTKDGLILAWVVEMGQTSVNGVEASWVRARLSEGKYRTPPQIKEFLSVLGGGARPPGDGFLNRTRLNLNAPFYPFGTEPGEGDIFYFGERGKRDGAGGGFPTTSGPNVTITGIILNVKMAPAVDLPPNVTLRWEYLSPSGWVEMASAVPEAPSVTDSTRALTRNGTVVLQLPSIPEPTPSEAKVNDKSDYWMRVRIDNGDYGRPAEFIPVDPDDPKQGFKVRPGTGNLEPPQIVSLTIDYDAKSTPTLVTQNGFLFRDESSDDERGFAPFVSVRELLPDIYADAEPTLYLGFDAAFPEEPVMLYVDVAPRAFAGAVVKETRNAPAPSSLLPPLRWEYFNGTAWRELTVFDATNNFTTSGKVSFLTPEDIAPLTKFDLTARFWVRARSSRNDPFDSQNLLGIFLNTIPALQAVTVQNEIIGSSNENPNQKFNFARPPVLPKQEVYVREPETPSDTERDRSEEDEGLDAISERTNPDTSETEIWVRWHEIDTFLRSDRHSRHYTLDRINGEIRFGDGVRGIVPPRATNNITATYRTSGGSNGNVKKTGIAQLKSALAGVAAVSNPVAADGGAEVETIPMIEERGPQTLRHRSRSVASGDLEWLAREAAGTRVARARCLSNINRDLRFEPGWATLIIVPGGREAKPSPSSVLIQEVEAYLDQRAFIGLAQQTPTRINVIGPGYIKVWVVAKIVPQDIDEAETVKQLLVAALKTFLHPLTGGPKGTGWEFGRDVYASEIAQALEGVTGVNHVQTLQLAANVVQHRLTFNSASSPIKELPAGSEVITSDRRKAALLAETVLSGGAVQRIKIKGFKEGDQLTRALDLRVTAVTPDGASVRIGVQKIDKSQVIADTVGFPGGSLVTTFDGARRMRLASAIPRCRPGQTLPITDILVEDSEVALNLATTFRPSDVLFLTAFYPFPMKVTSTRLETITLSVQSVRGSNITVSNFNTLIAGTPRNSIVSAFDDTRRARLAADIDANLVGLTTITVQEASFAALLRPGDELELHVPVQTLNIDPYEAEVAFPAESLMTSLDNRVRFPLLAEIAAGQPVTLITLHDFIPADTVSINRRDGTGNLSALAIDTVEPLADIVFLDDNFLVYSDSHRITIVGEAKDGSV
jgi:predicted phage baseplate assembly protein